MVEKILILIFANLIPTSEQIGAIPLGLALGLSPEVTFFVSISVNSLLFFPLFFCLNFFYEKFFSRIKPFNDYLKKLRKRGEPYVKKYGVIGVTMFIAIPSPLTGTYTGTMLSWLLDLNWKKSFLAIFLGSLIGGAIILLSSLGILNIIKFIIK
ncbi:MAG: small multi-drug export protein [Candidatus Aenigmatarchaeota archaeon]